MRYTNVNFSCHPAVTVKAAAKSLAGRTAFRAVVKKHSWQRAGEKRQVQLGGYDNATR